MHPQDQHLQSMLPSHQELLGVEVLSQKLCKHILTLQKSHCYLAMPQVCWILKRLTFCFNVKNGDPTLNLECLHWDALSDLQIGIVLKKWFKMSWIFHLQTSTLSVAVIFGHPMLFHIPGESRSYLSSNTTSISLAHRGGAVKIPKSGKWETRSHPFLDAFFHPLMMLGIRRPKEQELEEIAWRGWSIWRQCSNSTTSWHNVFFAGNPSLLRRSWI